MSNEARRIIVLAAAVAAIVPATARAVSLEVTERDDNEWGFGSSELGHANASDCESNVEFTFTVDLGADSTSTSGRNLYLYAGTSCDSAPEECVVLDGPQSAGDLSFEVTASSLFDSDCSASATANLWVGLLEFEDQAEDEDDDTYTIDGIWSESALEVSLDVSGPASAPSGVSATIGSGRAEISWNEMDDTDVAGYLVVYWNGTGGAGDADTDADTDTDADSDTDSDGDVDAGSDGGAKGPERFEPVPYANGDDDAGTDCEVPGGPEAGASFDPAAISGFDDGALSSPSTNSVTVDGLENGVAYEFAVVALDDHANPSAFSEVVCVQPEETTNFFDDYAAAGGKGGGKYCFVATAAYGSYDHPVVRVLRRFRDEFIEPAPGGEAVVAGYYAVGPHLAAALEGHDAIRDVVRGGLFVAAGAATALMAVGPVGVCTALLCCVLLGLVLGVAVPRRRREQ